MIFATEPPSPHTSPLAAEERREGILDAALAVFSQSGYHSSSIDDISRGRVRWLVSQVTAVVAALIAQDPGARAVEEQAAHERAIGLLAQTLVGSVQSVANWWADHQEVRREQIVDTVMDYAWLGLERVSAGERWPRDAG